MARIAGVNIPTNKRVVIALRYIHGIGPVNAREICKKINLPDSKRVNQLTDAEVLQIREMIDLYEVLFRAQEKAVQSAVVGASLGVVTAMAPTSTEVIGVGERTASVIVREPVTVMTPSSSPSDSASVCEG